MKILQIFKEQDGAWSARRVIAFIFTGYFPLLSGYAIHKMPGTLYAYIPAIICAVAVIFILFFTTWEDIKGIVSAYKGEQRKH